MKGYIADVEKLTLKNKNFRKVLYTDKHLQLVLMSLKPKEDIGEESHKLDQFIRIEKGSGQAVLNGLKRAVGAGSVVIVPSGTKHNIINTSSRQSLQIYTLYSPPNHRPGVVHKTKAQAEADEEHYAG